MTTIDLLKNAIKNSKYKNEIDALIYLVFYFLNKNILLSKLKLFKYLKEKIKKIDDSKKHSLLNIGSSFDLNKLIDLIEKKAKNEKNILGCPEIDDYSILLALIKIIEEKTNNNLGYKEILKEFIINHIHFIEKSKLEENFIGRSEEINKILRIIEKNFKNNILIIGDTGIGKTAILQKIKTEIKDKKVFEIFPGNKKLVDQLIEVGTEIKEKRVIFILDEIFSFDIETINLVINSFKIIASANIHSFEKFSNENKTLINKFELINLDEPDLEDIKKILIAKYHFFIKKNDFFVSKLEDNFFDEIINLCKKYIFDQAFPGKAISLLEETLAYAKLNNIRNINNEIVRIIASQKVNIPFSSLNDVEKKDLVKMKEKILKKVKGQEKAVNKIVKVFQRYKLGFKKSNRPIGSFLFIGPSGVGKTELAKTVAEEFFGSIESMIRIDMSEYTEAHTVQRLIGAPPGYIGFEEGGQLTNPVKKRPYSLVLLDEIEKAHPKIFDIFLQVLDDGRLTDGRGKTVDFTNTIIIATSNAGIDEIVDMINEGKTEEEIEKEINDILQDYFRLEFINRFDDIVIFNSLKTKDLKEIAKIQIENLQYELAKKNIKLIVKENTYDILAKQGYDPRFGARKLLRLIQDKIENQLVELIITNQLQENQVIEF